MALPPKKSDPAFSAPVELSSCLNVAYDRNVRCGIGNNFFSKWTLSVDCLFYAIFQKPVSPE